MVKQNEKLNLMIDDISDEEAKDVAFPDGEIIE